MCSNILEQTSEDPHILGSVSFHSTSENSACEDMSHFMNDRYPVVVSWSQRDDEVVDLSLREHGTGSQSSDGYSSAVGGESLPGRSLHDSIGVALRRSGCQIRTGRS